MKQFITTVHEAQLYAITHQQRVILIFIDNGRTYKLQGDGAIDILNGKISGQFPEGMRQAKHSKFENLNFTETGYLVHTGKMFFTTQSKGEISISFQFERGRMLVYE